MTQESGSIFFIYLFVGPCSELHPQLHDCRCHIVSYIVIHPLFISNMAWQRAFDSESLPIRLKFMSRDVQLDTKSLRNQHLDKLAASCVDFADRGIE